MVGDDMATKKATTKKTGKKQMSEDRFTAQPSNLSNVRWAPGYGPKAKKKSK